MNKRLKQAWHFPYKISLLLTFPSCKVWFQRLYFIGRKVAISEFRIGKHAKIKTWIKPQLCTCWVLDGVWWLMYSIKIVLILWKIKQQRLHICFNTNYLSHGSLRRFEDRSNTGWDSSSPLRLSGCPNVVKSRDSRLLNHYVMCRAASSGAGDSAESCWGEFYSI